MDQWAVAFVTAGERRALVAATALAVAAALGGCDLVSKPPAPDAAAKALADALAGGDLGAVRFDGATAANVSAFLTSAVGDLKDWRRTVTVSQVSQPKSNEIAATATLAFAWTPPTVAAVATPAGGSATDAPAGPVTAASPTTSPATSPTPAAGATGDGGSAGAGEEPLWRYSTTANLTRAQDQSWHVTWSPGLFAPNLTGTEHLTLATVAAKRGDIVGANNTPLMTQRPTAQVGIDKTKVAADQQAASAAALAQLVGNDSDAYVSAVRNAGPRAFVAAITVRADDPLVTSQLGQVAAIPGAVSITGASVVGPSPGFARSLLGTVGDATADVVAKSKGLIKQGDVVGLSGLEQRYDARLRGTPGFSIRAVGTDAAGTSSQRDLFTSPAVDGKPLGITLDQTAQTVAEAVLAAGPTDTPTALVALRLSTGEIVAAANGPGSHGLPIGTTGRAEPGSTFKIVSSLALLRAGLTPDSLVPCTPTILIGGRSFRNYSDYPPNSTGDIPLRTALAKSCNTAFIAQSTKISPADLASAAAALGVGVDLDLGFPAYLGSVPATASATEHAASMIGQSKVLMAPMDMATVIASAVHGSVVRPRLVDDNPAVASFPTPDKPLTATESQALQSMLGSVVSDGSGQILKDDGVTAAKTGTAEYGTAQPPLTHTWMVAVKDDLAVAVYVETGESGSKTAGPLLKSFLEGYHD